MNLDRCSTTSSNSNTNPMVRPSISPPPTIFSLTRSHRLDGQVQVVCEQCRDLGQCGDDSSRYVRLHRVPCWRPSRRLWVQAILRPREHGAKVESCYLVCSDSQYIFLVHTNSPSVFRCRVSLLMADEITPATTPINEVHPHLSYPYEKRTPAHNLLLLLLTTRRLPTLRSLTRQCIGKDGPLDLARRRNDRRSVVWREYTIVGLEGNFLPLFPSDLLDVLSQFLENPSRAIPDQLSRYI